MSVVPFTLEGFTIAPYARRPTRIVLFSTDSESIYICRIGNASTWQGWTQPQRVSKGRRDSSATVALASGNPEWRRYYSGSGSFTDVSTMPECDNHDQKNSVVHGVQDAIIPHSESISCPTT